MVKAMFNQTMFNQTMFNQTMHNQTMFYQVTQPPLTLTLLLRSMALMARAGYYAPLYLVRGG
jgi:hypothetical protein